VRLAWLVNPAGEEYAYFERNPESGKTAKNMQFYEKML